MKVSICFFIENSRGLLEESKEQEFEEIDLQLDKNPAGIWLILNDMAANLLELQTTIKDMQPFLY